jgi:hypothetical protein
MSGNSALAVQTALYSKLTGAAAVTALVGTRVYSRAPDEATFPYIAIGEDVAVEWASKTFDGMDISVTIHVWSRYRGNKECLQIMAAVYDALHNVSLTVTGQNHIFTRFEFQTTMGDPDGITYHGIQRFQIITHA